MCIEVERNVPCNVVTLYIMNPCELGERGIRVLSENITTRRVRRVHVAWNESRCAVVPSETQSGYFTCNADLDIV